MRVPAKSGWVAASAVRWLLGAWLFGGCRAAPATPAVAATAQPTPSSPGALVAALPGACHRGGVQLRVDEVGAEMGAAAAGGVLGWRGHLNEDEWLDVIVRFPDSCSSYGECEHSVYFGCGDGRFASVYGPEYSLSLAPDLAAGTRPVVLRELRRKDSFEEPGATWTVLRYEGGRYAPVR